MKKRLAFAIGFVFLVLLIAPVVKKQNSSHTERNLVGVELSSMTYQEVSFRNVEQNLNLTGMLFLPDGEKPYPAVVIIHGSGSSQRDNPWYLSLTKYLQDNGIAVLLPDKRGSVESEGDWRSATFYELATDTIAGIEFLQDEYKDQIHSIGVLGASQGGQIAPIAATRSDDISFVINVVGSVVPFHQALIYEENHNLREMGLLPGFSNVIAHISSFYIRNFSQREFWDAVGNYDPLPYWEQVDIPALILFGSDDTNTPTQKSVDRLNQAGKSNIEIAVFEDSGHALESPPGEGNDYFRAEALAQISEFIFNIVGKTGHHPTQSLYKP
jgi:dipeptidyl aminopeptidase/acylaminoacyl peptidase